MATEPGVRQVAKEAARQAAKAAAPATREVARTAKKVEQSSKQVEKSTKAVERGTKEVVSDTNQQVLLAADRTLLATERTFAAWVRTGLSSLAAGVGARALLEKVIPLWLAKTTGSVLVVFAGFCFIAAVWRHLWRPVPPPGLDLRPIPRALLVPLSAFLLLVAIAALVGIWTA
jgi:putative membrane protein